MDITVTFNGGRWVTDPSLAIVAIGTEVRWIFRSPDQETRALVWRVSFKALNPFGEGGEALEVRTRSAESQRWVSRDFEFLRQLGLEEDAALIHRGVTDAKLAGQTGEFKYDLSVHDAETGEIIGEDDPWLIVVRGVMRPFDLYVF
jgi:hypothetical protein